ncbi:glycosyltransferase family 4 protein [uncultured Bacteroides sp.]|uniref:glycosyltransferase family 4 protein n=1 Tax=uncultured Bacteroides sp. TaxID=162156 RepID=UPI002AAB21A5|nr:glycosyltransferase family 4 protein [uncultured Bacteroides sp.]
MKICFYCNTIFTFGGVQRVTAVIAKELSKQHDITILTLDDSSLNNTTMYKLNSANIQYVNLQYNKSPFFENIPCKIYSLLYKTVLPQNQLFSKWYGYSSFPHTQRSLLINILNEQEYDVVIGVHVFLSFHLASIRKQIKAKTIGWMHNSYDAFFTIKTSYIKKQKNQFKYLMPNLDNIIVLSNSDQEKFKKKMNIQTSVIYNPLTIEPKGKGSPKYKKFLAVGRFSPFHKGFDILIKAFALFAKRDKIWTLDIVGEGTEEKKLHSLISKYQLENRIHIHPFTKNIEQYYNSSSVYILSSRWEGFGLVLLEAMSYGLPIISSYLPITKELLEGKGVGFFFENENIADLSEKMKFVTEKVNIINISKIAFNYSQKFSILKITQEWNKILLELTKR